MSEQQTVYCVKYALSKGIFKVTGRVTSEGYFSEDHRKGHLFLAKADWFCTLDDAMQAAEALRKKKIQSLQKQINQMQSLTVKEVER